jgi:hypothetical protein
LEEPAAAPAPALPRYKYPEILLRPECRGKDDLTVEDFLFPDVAIAWKWSLQTWKFVLFPDDGVYGKFLPLLEESLRRLRCQAAQHNQKLRDILDCYLRDDAEARERVTAPGLNRGPKAFHQEIKEILQACQERPSGKIVLPDNGVDVQGVA